MSFLKTLFWIVVAVLVALFAFSNWTVVPVSLWDGMILETKLPVLLIIAFLLGLLPPLILYRTTRWRLHRKLQSAERALADVNGPAVAPPPPPIEGAMPPAAISTIVPPGGA